MKFTAAIAALVGVAAASPIAVEAPIEKRATPLNYVQNYNGNLANFKYNLQAGTYSASWNNPGDFVIGLGWTTGAQRVISFSGSYTTSSSSYYTVYGWLNSPLTEYYIVENYSYNPCNGATAAGSLTSDGSSYNVCKHTQVNQPSITGTATFGQYFSVRANKRTSGSVTIANHFTQWKTSGFQPGNYNYQVFAVEAFGGTGSASVTVSEGTASTGGSTTTSASSTVVSSSAPTSVSSATSACTNTITRTSSAPSSPTSATSSASAPTSSSGSGGSCSALYGQCGGQGWSGPTCCQSGSTCKYSNDWYSQCL